jgi:single-strand DNA-binding protein
MIFNELNLVGNLGADCEVKYTKNNVYFLNFSICHNEVKKNANSGWDVTNSWWMNCIAYGDEAQQYESMLIKGKRVRVKGRLTINKWVDKDGKEHKYPQLIVKGIESV